MIGDVPKVTNHEDNTPCSALYNIVVGDHPWCHLFPKTRQYINQIKNEGENEGCLLSHLASTMNSPINIPM
jgi:hypothetical protein